MQAKDRIIVAIDINDLNHACELVEKLSSYVGCFKIGLEFIYSAFKDLVMSRDVDVEGQLQLLRYFFNEARGKVFIDSKLNDIPNTVGGASNAIRDMNPKFFNVHALSGQHAVEKAAKNKGNSKLLVVTVLTSLKFSELWYIGLGRCVYPDCYKYYTGVWQEKFVKNLVEVMATWSYACGADGIICSPQELLLLKNYKGLKVTPGIRPKWAQKNDQARIMTPGEAIKAGADYLVIGRPITNPPLHIGTPEQAVKLIIEEIEGAL